MNNLTTNTCGLKNLARALGVKTLEIKITPQITAIMLILSKLITIIIVLTIAFTTILQPQAKNTKQSLFVYYSPEQKSHVNTRYTTHVLQLHKWREYNHTRVFVLALAVH